jgi:hypothetical protein
MEIGKILEVALQMRATEVTIEVGAATSMQTPGGTRTIFNSAIKAPDFEARILGRLDPFARDKLRTSGRCDVDLEEKGVGTIHAEISAHKARLIFPAVAAPMARAASPREPRPETVMDGFLRSVFGRK